MLTLTVLRLTTPLPCIRRRRASMANTYVKNLGLLNLFRTGCVLSSLSLAAASAWVEQQEIAATDAAAGDYFGNFVSISGDYALVAARRDDSDQGSAYIFHRTGSTWSQQAKLVASNGAANDHFGMSASISGDYAIVGAYGRDVSGRANQGGAYVFYRNGTSWVEQAALIASDGAAGDQFGYAVSISGDYAVIGSNLRSSSQGGAYVFQRTGAVWAEHATLVPADNAPSGEFGISVAIHGDSIIVGAHRDSTISSIQGSAYVFVRSGSVWSQQGKLTALDGAANDRFGSAVSISSDSAVVGAFQADSEQGSAYTFIRSATTWSQQQKLTASDGRANSWFGYSVSISGDSVIIGSPAYDGPSSLTSANYGAAYFFNRSGTTWTEQQKLVSSDNAQYDMFGWSVAISSDDSVIGAYVADNSAFNSGSAYVFTRPASAGPSSSSPSPSPGPSSSSPSPSPGPTQGSNAPVASAQPSAYQTAFAALTVALTFLQL